MKANDNGLVRLWRVDKQVWQEVDPVKAAHLFSVELASDSKPELPKAAPAKRKVKTDA